MQSVAKKHHRSGQAMLIAVLSLGGAILGATTVAGLLTLYQIRATTDTENSAKAIFAADAGTQWALFDFYCISEGRCLPGGLPPITLLPASGATVKVTCYSDFEATVPSDCKNPVTIAGISTGISLSSERALFLSLQTATTSYP